MEQARRLADPLLGPSPTSSTEDLAPAARTPDLRLEHSRRRSRLADPLGPSPTSSFEDVAPAARRPDLRMYARRAVVGVDALAQIESMGRVVKEARLRGLVYEATARAEEEEAVQLRSLAW